MIALDTDELDLDDLVAIRLLQFPISFETVPELAGASLSRQSQNLLLTALRSDSEALFYHSSGQLDCELTQVATIFQFVSSLGPCGDHSQAPRRVPYHSAGERKTRIEYILYSTRLQLPVVSGDHCYLLHIV